MTVVVRVPLLLRKGYAEGAKRDKEVTGGRRFREPAPPSEDLPQAPGHQRQAWWCAMNSYLCIDRCRYLQALLGSLLPQVFSNGAGACPAGPATTCPMAAHLAVSHPQTALRRSPAVESLTAAREPPIRGKAAAWPARQAAKARTRTRAVQRFLRGMARHSFWRPSRAAVMAGRGNRGSSRVAPSGTNRADAPDSSPRIAVSSLRIVSSPEGKRFPSIGVNALVPEPAAPARRRPPRGPAARLPAPCRSVSPCWAAAPRPGYR